MPIWKSLFRCFGQPPNLALQQDPVQHHNLQEVHGSSARTRAFEQALPDEWPQHGALAPRSRPQTSASANGTVEDAPRNSAPSTVCSAAASTSPLVTLAPRRSSQPAANPVLDMSAKRVYGANPGYPLQPFPADNDRWSAGDVIMHGGRHLQGFGVAPPTSSLSAPGEAFDSHRPARPPITVSLTSRQSRKQAAAAVATEAAAVAAAAAAATASSWDTQHPGAQGQQQRLAAAAAASVAAAGVRASSQQSVGGLSEHTAPGSTCQESLRAASLSGGRGSGWGHSSPPKSPHDVDRSSDPMPHVRRPSRIVRNTSMPLPSSLSQPPAPTGRVRILDCRVAVSYLPATSRSSRGRTHSGSGGATRASFAAASRSGSGATDPLAQALGAMGVTRRVSLRMESRGRHMAHEDASGWRSGGGGGAAASLRIARGSSGISVDGVGGRAGKHDEQRPPVGAHASKFSSSSSLGQHLRQRRASLEEADGFQLKAASALAAYRGVQLGSSSGRRT